MSTCEQIYLNNDKCPTDHKPVDTGLGFTCDEGVMELVLALNSVHGIKTLGSCERTEWGWVVRRGYVIFEAENPERLLQICTQIRDGMNPEQAWNQTIHVDNYKHPQAIFAELTFPPCAYKYLVEVVTNLKSESHREASPK